MSDCEHYSRIGTHTGTCVSVNVASFWRTKQQNTSIKNSKSKSHTF